MLLEDAEHVPVNFAGDVTISNIDEARSELGAVLGQHGPIVMDISGVTDADLTFVQLIESARRKAADAGRDFTLRQPADGAVLEVLRRGGFLDDDSCDRAKFWLQEATL